MTLRLSLVPNTQSDAPFTILRDRCTSDTTDHTFSSDPFSTVNDKPMVILNTNENTPLETKSDIKKIGKN